MHTAFRCTLVILSFIVSQYSFAIDYKFTGNGSWSDPNNWEGGLKPPSRLETGNTITIFGTTINGQSCGEFCSTDLGHNRGTITIATGGSLTINNATQFTNEGVINVEGTLINQTAFQAASTGTVNVSGTFVNQIFFGNQGHLIINDGGVLKNEVVEGVTHRSAFGRGVFANDFINPGKITIHSGGTINNVAPAVITLGNVINNGGTINNYSILKGNPTITGNLLNIGTLAPGNSPGTFEISGSYMATSTAVHQFEVGGITDGTYDLLKVSGTVNLSGTLNVTLVNGFSSTTPHQIPIITGAIRGTFSSVVLPDNYSLIYTANSVVLNRLSIETVTFNSFTAVKDGAVGKINWTVQNEADVIRYEVERNTSGSFYMNIGTVTATKTGTYSFTELSPEPSAYYRIKCIYPNGIITYNQPVFKYQTTNINTFNGIGNWSDAAKWSSGSVPTDLFPGQYLFINGDCRFDLNTFTNEGKVEILTGSKLNLTKGEVINKGELVVWGTLENNAERYENVDTTFLSGTILNNSVFVNTSAAMSMESGSTFINNITGTYSSGTVWLVASSGFVNYGSMSGILTIAGNFLNESTLAPGNSPGTCTVKGNYTASASAKHIFEVDGLSAGTFDVLRVERIAYLNGAMNITLKPGVIISGSTEIPIITGSISGKFSSVSLPEGLMLEYKAGSVVLKVSTPLPVRFVKLEGKKQNNEVKLTWMVADEKGVSRYEVEKSLDGYQFSKIGNVQAALKNDYSFIDYTSKPVAYYRVKSIDEDEKHGYSQIIFLKGEANTVVLKAFLAASGSELVVQHPTAVIGNKIYIHSMDCQLLKVALPQNGSQQSTIDFPFIQPGIYLISYGSDKGVWESTKLFKP